MIKTILKMVRNGVVALLCPFVQAQYQTIWMLRNRILSKKRAYLLEQCYWRWCSQFCAWIGLGASIDGEILLPHDLNGIFISQNARIGKNCIFLHQVTIGSEVLSNRGGHR